MGDYVANMVRICADEDLAAYFTLRGYDARYR